MATRIVIEEPCEHGKIDAHESESWVKFPYTMHICPGGSRRVLDPGSYVLIEKVDGEWPEWALDAASPFAVVQMHDCKGLASREPSDILDALAGGES